MLSKYLINFLKKNKKNILKSKVLCIGDIILDHYISGTVERFSPEAPVPILNMLSQNYKIGGAGNVAINISSVGAKSTIIFLSGLDSSSKIVKKIFNKEKNIKKININIKNFYTPTKTRFINTKNHLLRVDNEKSNFKLLNRQKLKIIEIFKKEVKKNDIVVLSDYNKGLLDRDLIKRIINICKKSNKPIIADPKKSDLSFYNGVDVLTPNQKEMTDAANKNSLNERNLIKFANTLVGKNKINNILITRSEKGMLLVNENSVKKN